MTLLLEEKNELPDGYKGQPFHSKGFLPPVLIEDFPIRGNKVLLQIKRRRWEHQQTGEIISRDNLTETLSIDETALSNGELYTIVTSKAARGRKGTLVTASKPLLFRHFFFSKSDK